VTFKIEKGVPIPGQHNNRGMAQTLRLLEIGDSFVAPGKNSSIRSNMAYIARRTGRKFVARQEGEGVRIWRIQ